MSSTVTEKKSQYRIVAAMCIGAILAVAAMVIWVWWANYRSGGPARPTGEVEGTPFTYEYVPPKDPRLKPIYEKLRDMDLFRHLTEIQATDGVFVLPNPVRFVTAECHDHEVNAFYSSATGEMVLCYEIALSILDKGRQLQKEWKEGKDFPDRFLVGSLRFIMLHELGHAVIGQLDLSITGREETAADEFAAVMLLQYVDHGETRGGVEESLIYAGAYLMHDREEPGPDDAELADVHEMGEQRYFNLLCMIYGSDPSEFLSIVTDDGLPKERAASCPAYSARMMRSWGDLLYPHVATKNQVTTEEWQAQGARGRAAQDKNAGQYVR